MTLLSDFKLNIINVGLGHCYLLAYSGEKLKIVYMVGKLNAGCKHLLWPFSCLMDASWIVQQSMCLSKKSEN